MFTGIIEEIGYLREIQREPQTATLTIGARGILENIKLGDSIAVNGVCLTAIRHQESSFTAEVSPETLSRSNLGALRLNQEVNLERPLRAGDRLGGHMVTGHIDAIGRIAGIEKRGKSFLVTVEAPPEIMRYVVEKGSVAVDGISLTIAAFNENTFSVAVVPFTSQNTILGRKRVSDPVNLEGDILGKYVEKFLGQGKQSYNAPSRKVDETFLLKHGFL